MKKTMADILDEALDRLVWHHYDDPDVVVVEKEAPGRYTIASWDFDPDEEPPANPLAELLAGVRAGDADAAERLIRCFGADPAENGAYADFVGPVRVLGGGFVEIGVDSPWLDIWEENHPRRSWVALTPSNRLMFRASGGVLEIPVDRFNPVYTGDLDECSRYVWRIG